MAELTQCTVADAENFIREAFHLAAEKLESDRRVELPGVGTFIVTDDNIAFAPDPTLAGEINAPFAAFEAVELPDEDVAEENEDNEAALAEAVEPAEPVEPAQEAEESVADEEPESPPETSEEDAVATEAIVDSAEFEEKEDAEEPEEEPAGAVTRTHTVHHWVWAAACLLCFALGWFARGFEPGISPAPKPETADTETFDTVATSPEPDSLTSPAQAPRPAKPVRAVTTDTVTAGRFLTTMARAHYGRMEFWVYIYEANAAKLGHPDRLDAGTVVVIPPADSLGLSADDESQIDIAERKAAEIYARFN